MPAETATARPSRSSSVTIPLLLVLLGAAFSVRFSIGSNRTASWFDLGALIVAPASLIGLALSPRRFEYPKGIIGSAVFIGLLSWVSLGWSGHVGSTPLLHGISWMEAAVVVAFCAGRVAPALRPEQIMRWIAVFATLLVATAVALLLHVPGFRPPPDVNPLSGDYLSYYTRLSHPYLGRSNNLATLLAVFFLPLAWWAAEYRRHRVVTLLVGAALVATLSRGVLIGVIIAAILSTPSSRRTARRLGRSLIGLATVGVLGFLLTALAVPTVRDYFSTRFSVANIADRADLVNLGSQQIVRHPFLGIGGGVGENIHNTFLQQLIYYGLGLGLVAAIAIAVVPRWFFKRGTPIATICGWSVVAVWISCLVESSLEGTLLLPEVFFAVGLLVALSLSWERFGPPAAGYARQRRSHRPEPRPVVPRVPKAPVAAGRIPSAEELSPTARRAFGLD